jgi:hypothetical protein
MALGLRRSDDTLTLISRVRRAMPRNLDVMAVCERCEELIRAQAGQARKRERSGDDLDRIREQTRLRVQRHRAKKKRKGSR